MLLLQFDTEDICKQFLQNLHIDTQVCKARLQYNLQKTLSPTDKIINNNYLEIQLDNQGLIEKLTNLKEGTKIKIAQKFMSYDGKITYSGLYIFNPILDPIDIANIEVKYVLTYKGPLQ